MAKRNKDEAGPRPSARAPVPEGRKRTAKKRTPGIARPRSAPFRPQVKPPATGTETAPPAPSRRKTYDPLIEDQIPTEQFFHDQTAAPPPPPPERSNAGLQPAQGKAKPSPPSPHEGSFQAMYRISPPGEEGLTQFGTTALRRGGVFIRTGHAPPVGTPVMVCVVHPVSGDEFPLKGEVVSINATAKKSAGIAVQFVRKGPVVEKEYQYFVALGLPDDNRAIQSQSDVQTDEIARVADNADTDPSQPILAAQEFDEPQASTIDIELTELEIIAELTPKGIHVQPLSSGTSDETADAQQLDSNNDSSGRGGHDR